MAALNKCIFRKNEVGCHQQVLKFKLGLAIARRTFKPILDCFIPNFKLKHGDSENIKADRVSTVVFNLHQIKGRAFFLDTRYVTGDFKSWESPETSPALFIGPFEYVTRFQNLKFIVRRTKNFQSSVLSSSESTAATYLAFKVTPTTFLRN